jgi:hypothetical protein
MEFDHVTNRYLDPKSYIKMIPYFLKKTYTKSNVGQQGPSTKVKV